MEWQIPGTVLKIPREDAGGKLSAALQTSQYKHLHHIIHSIIQREFPFVKRENEKIHYYIIDGNAV